MSVMVEQKVEFINYSMLHQSVLGQPYYLPIGEWVDKSALAWSGQGRVWVGIIHLSLIRMYCGHSIV